MAEKCLNTKSLYKEFLAFQVFEAFSSEIDKMLTFWPKCEF